MGNSQSSKRGTCGTSSSPNPYLQQVLSPPAPVSQPPSLPECRTPRTLEERSNAAKTGMLTLSSMMCSSCGQQARVEIFRKGRVAGMCTKHGSFVCSRCRQSFPMERCQFQSNTKLTAAIFLATAGCRDEMKFLNFGKWNPLRCRSCQSSFVESADKECENCWYLRSNTSVLVRYTNIIAELRTLFSDSVSVPTENQHNTDERMRAITDCLSCSECKCSKTEFLTRAGHLMCKPCDRIYETKSAFRFPNHLSYIGILIPYIFPDFDELKTLTYEKWTPFRCDACSTPFSEKANEIPIYNPEQDIICCKQCYLNAKQGRNVPVKFLLKMIKIFKGFFKQELEVNTSLEDPSTSSNMQSEIEQRQSTSYLITPGTEPLAVMEVSPQVALGKPCETVSSGRHMSPKQENSEALNQSGNNPNIREMNTSTPEERKGALRIKTKVYFPRKFSCFCGEEENIKHMYKCVGCNQPDQCPRCFMSYHIEHGQPVKMQTELIRERVETEKTTTLTKMTQFTSKLNDLNGQIDAARRELNERLSRALNIAAASQDIDAMESILGKCDVTALMEPTTKLRKARKQLTRKVAKRAEKLDGSSLLF